VKVRTIHAVPSTRGKISFLVIELLTNSFVSVVESEVFSHSSESRGVLRSKGRTCFGRAFQAFKAFMISWSSLYILCGFVKHGKKVSQEKGENRRRIRARLNLPCGEHDSSAQVLVKTKRFRISRRLFSILYQHNNIFIARGEHSFVVSLMSLIACHRKQVHCQRESRLQDHTR